MESDDDFDMLPVKRRGPPVIKSPLMSPTKTNGNVNFQIGNDGDIVDSGTIGMAGDFDSLPVKRRGPPKVNGLSSEKLQIQKNYEKESERTEKEEVQSSINGNQSNESSYGYHDILSIDSMDSPPIKRRGSPPVISNGNTILKPMDTQQLVRDDNPFDECDIPMDVPSISRMEQERGKVDKGTVGNVLPKEVLYNTLVNDFDQFGFDGRNLNGTSSSFIDTDNVIDNISDDYLECDIPAARKSKKLTTQEVPISNNGQLNIKDFEDEDDFQPIGHSNFVDDLDFLEQCGGNDMCAAEELSRKSLYVKFDPLCNNRKLAKDLTFVKDGTISEESVHTGHNSNTRNKAIPSHQNDQHTNIQQSSLIDPFSPVKEQKSSKDDLEEMFPTPKPYMGDRINSGLVDPLLYSQSDMDEVVRKAKCDLNDDVNARELDWKKKYEELDAKIKEEVAMRELIEQDYRGKIDCLRKDNVDMKQVLMQYERTIVELTENSHHDTKSNEDILAEAIRAKEQLSEDINSAEQNLFDAYKRIEKLKKTIDTYKQNENSLKENNSMLHGKLKSSEDRYSKLRDHASEKIDSANMVINKVRKQQEIDLVGLQAALRKAQNKVNNLELEVQQKNIENQQLSQICDDLIKKVSGE